MYISSMHIDRFGIWTDLALEGISDGLNVIYGSDGSGRTTAVQFIRAMLYGFDHETRKGQNSAEIRDAGGSLTVKGPFGRQTIQRYDGGNGQQGRLNIRRDDGSVVENHQLQDVLPDAQQSVFDQVFALDFKNGTDINRLIERVSAHGFDLLDGPEDTGRLAELKERLRIKRGDYAQLTAPDETRDQLTRRRESLQQQIQSLKTSGLDQHASVDRRLRKMDGELAELEEQLDELQDELRSLDARIGAREEERQRKEEAFREARSRSQRQRTERREALKELDAQLERWRLVLQDIEGHGRRLRNTAGVPDIPEATVPGDPRRCLQQLENRMDGLHQSVAEMGLLNDPDDCQCGHWKSTLAPAIQEMQSDVYRLCNEFGQWEESSRRTTSSSELSQLGRCEAELRTAISGLVRRRQLLLAEITQAGDATLDTLAPTHPQWCTCKEHHSQPDETPLALDIPAEEEEVLSLLSAEISQLVARRQEVRSDIATVEDEIQDLQNRRRELEATSGPSVEQRRIEALRSELRRVEEMLAWIERRRELAAAISHLEREIRDLEATVRQPSVLREASDLLRRLTEGELHKISSTPDRSVQTHDRLGRQVSYHQLSPSARDQVYLSICLALVAAYGREGVRLPLILNNALTNIDVRGLQAAATLLRDFCQRGHQILLFTGKQNIADQFRAIDVTVRVLPNVVRQVQLPRAYRQQSPGLSETRRQELNRQLNAIADEVDRKSKRVDYAAWNAEEFPGELTDRVKPQESAERQDASETVEEVLDSEYFLLETSPIQDAPSIDAATAERFRKIGVLLVRDLLRLDVSQAADRLRYAGITASMIRRWRAESLLVCRVPHLRGYDARILVGCGVTDPDQLADMEAAELQRRVERFAATSTGQVFLQAGNRYELSRITDWIRSARGKRRGRSERRSYRGPSHDTTRSRDSRRRSERSGSSQSSSERSSERRTERRTERTTGSRSRKTETTSSSTGERTEARPVVLKMEQSQEQLRFYLNTHDSIEQAPSIGPRMAERFEAIGIVTVSDFLEADAASMAERLDRRRVTADTIRTWQLQTTLACRIPWLRGHDAQILIACGVEDVETLAKMEANDLWTVVEPFTVTSQCKRIIRNGKAPDLAEVNDWIQWARNARHLQAA